MSETRQYVVPNFALESGEYLAPALQAYQIYGILNAQRDNAILFPTRVMGTIENNLLMLGSGRALDPDRYCIIIPALLGNGQSSSPSNQCGADFPAVTIADAVRLQHHLVTKQLGITRLHAVVGWSMGGQQAYQWASLYSDMVPRLAVICGAAATSDFSRLFLGSLTATLMCDPAWQSPQSDIVPVNGLKAVSRIWAPWAFSEPWYRARQYRKLGFETLEEFLVGFWETKALTWNPQNLLCHIEMWKAHDISQSFGGDRAAALRAIRSDTLLMPCDTDAYFQVTDSIKEATDINQAQLEIIRSDWGHNAGAGTSTVDNAKIDAAVGALLSR